MKGLRPDGVLWPARLGSRRHHRELPGLPNLGPAGIDDLAPRRCTIAAAPPRRIKRSSFELGWGGRIFSGPSYYPPGTIDGRVANPRSVGWTLNCGGRVSRWTGEADAALDELHMRPVDGSADEERVYYREPTKNGLPGELESDLPA